MDDFTTLAAAAAAVRGVPCEHCGALMSVAIERVLLDDEWCRAYVARCERARGTIAQVLDREALTRHDSAVLGRVH